MMARAVTEQLISCMTVVHLVLRSDILMLVNIKIAMFLDDTVLSGKYVTEIKSSWLPPSSNDIPRDCHL